MAFTIADSTGRIRVDGMAATQWAFPGAATLALVMGTVLCTATPAATQTAAQPAAEPAAFVDALIAFHSALFGTYGDEGTEVTAALDRMVVALDAWERAQAQMDAELGRGGTAAPVVRALFYAGHHQLEAAILATREAIAAEPSRAPLHVYLGRLHDALGQRAEAAAAFDAARSLDPSDPLAAYLAGLHLIERAVTDGGEDALARVVATLMRAVDRRGPRPVVPHFALIDDLAAPTRVFAPPAYEQGFTDITRRRFREAIASFRAALAQDPLVSDPAGKSERVRGGIAALRARRGAAAIEQLEAAVREFPGSSEARRVLGIAYRAAGRLPEAAASFEQAVTLAPADERARVALGSTLAEASKLDEAERVLLDTIVRLPASGEARWALALVYERLDRGDEAIRVLEQAASLIVVAGKASLYWRIAQMVHGYHRDHARVIELAARRVRLMPNEPHAHKDLGLAYSRAGRDNEALLELLMATLLGHEDAEMLTAIGQIHLRQECEGSGCLARAEAALLRAVSLDPGFAEARYALARTLQRLGRAAEAAEHLSAFDRLRQAAFDEQRRTFERESLR
jgi:tetratricopeptide (TPR) repeat protein